MRVEWDFADYEEVASWVNGGYGDPDQKYQTADEKSASRMSLRSLVTP